MRERTGSIMKRKPKRKGEPATWWARLTYTDPLTGKRRDLQRRATSKSNAIDLRDQLVVEYDETQGRSLDRSHMTFNELCDYFEEHYLKPAEYVGGRKIAGVRSIAPVLTTLKALRASFGPRPLRSITYEDLREYRALRFKAPTTNGPGLPRYLANVEAAAKGNKAMRAELEALGIDVRRAAADRTEAIRLLSQAVTRLGDKALQNESLGRILVRPKREAEDGETPTGETGVEWPHVKPATVLAACKGLERSQRSVACVNRELSKLRRLLNIAYREGWITRNPFTAGDRGEPLIGTANERKRDRILTRDEEQRLLIACGDTRPHLRALIIAAIDTGCRLGELLKLRWVDLSIEEETIAIQALNTKMMRQRHVAISARLKLELERLWSNSPRDRNALVFGIHNNVKRSWTTVRRLASLPDVRFHDLRHTHGSRLDQMGFSLAQIGAQLGHTQVQTTLRYINRNGDDVSRVGRALDFFNTQEGSNESTDDASSIVN